MSVILFVLAVALITGGGIALMVLSRTQPSNKALMAERMYLSVAFVVLVALAGVAFAIGSGGLVFVAGTPALLGFVALEDAFLNGARR